MKKRQSLIIFLILSVFTISLFGQVEEEQVQERKRTKKISPNAIRFEQMFEEKEMTKEGFQELQDQRKTRLQARLASPDALETAVKPDVYIVGPGDIFTFNIWGALENQIPVTVTPEGKLLIPSVGELVVDGKTLREVQQCVIQKSKPFYQNSEISLSLITPRFFRVHVVGEVIYPGTYVGQPMNRISDMIAEAGGPTEWAWLRKIEVRHENSSTDYFDMSDFEQRGDIENNLFVNGGDVIYVPPMQLGSDFVEVEGELENAGTYQIFPDETLMAFLQRIRVIERNMDITKIIVIRADIDPKKKKIVDNYLRPFETLGVEHQEFKIINGDRILIPSKYVYVKGAARMPGAYPYALNLRAKDYAGMAGGDYRSGNIKKVKVFHSRTRKFEKGPNILVEAGDVVELQQSWIEQSRSVLTIISTVASIVVAAKAVGAFGD